ncbi:MAG: NADH-quinone oxidoreductase subunit N [Bdellovibrionota bacterium]
MNLISGIYPEIILTLGIVLILLCDIFLSSRASKKITSNIALGTLLVSSFSIAFNINFFLRELFFINSNIIVDSLAIVFKFIFLLGGTLAIIISKNSNFLLDKKAGEFYALLLGAILGAMLIVSSNNILLFYLSFEMLSISSYVLVGFGKKKSKEGALKYALYGCVSSALMILGFSYIYGLTGTIDISRNVFAISDMLTLNYNVFPITASLLLVLVGIGYKISSFPFHFWTPDAYEGAPTSIAAFLAVVSASAGFSFLLRVLLIPTCLWYEYFWIGENLNLYQIILGTLAVFSMCYGNFVAIRQNNLKRLMGYSSIAHTGYMLLALSTGDKTAIKAVMFYLIVYFFMNFVIFMFINFVEKFLDTNKDINKDKNASDSNTCDSNGSDSNASDIKDKEITFESIKGLGGTFPIIGGAVFIALVSLSGLPPTGGFSGKFLLFNSVIKRALTFKEMGVPSFFYFLLAFIGVANSVVSLYYYLKIPKAMFLERGEFEELGDKVRDAFLIDKVCILLCAIPILLLLNFSIIDFLAFVGE